MTSLDAPAHGTSCAEVVVVLCGRSYSGAEIGTAREFPLLPGRGGRAGPGPRRGPLRPVASPAPGTDAPALRSFEQAEQTGNIHRERCMSCGCSWQAGPE